MEIILKVLTMYGIAFCIAMFVALIIWVLYEAATNDKINKFGNLSTYRNLLNSKKSFEGEES